MKRDSLIQHLGEDRERHHGAAAPVIYRTSLFAFPDCASLEAYFHGDRSRHLYSRDSNPTVRMLEEKIAELEAAEDALAFASGMGAISGVLCSLLSAGDHMIVLSRAYVPTLLLARHVLRKFGVEVTFVDPLDVPGLEAHIRETTRVIYMESPASLTFEVVDLAAVAAIARRHEIITVTDNSWASPLYQQPVRRGIDISLHSGTKYINGHSDILLGLVAGSASLMRRIRPTLSLLGACLSPADASLALRGLRTLPLRLAKHEESALRIARQLEAHPRVRQVLHPALPGFSSHELWQRQFTGSSGLFAFILDGDACRFCDALELFLLGVSWGGHESLAFPPAIAGPSDPAAGPRPDVGPGLVRLSIGLEDPDDLWRDLEQALDRIGPG